MVAGSQLEKDSYFSKLSAAVVKVVLGFWDSPAAEVDENLLSWKKQLYQKFDPEIQKAQSPQTPCRRVPGVAEITSGQFDEPKNEKPGGQR